MFDRLRAGMANALEILAARMTGDPRYPQASRIPYLQRTLAGVRITPDEAITISAVWACLRYLSQSVAVLPWHVMRGGKRGAEIALMHPLDYLLSRRVSDEWSSFQFRETLTHWALRYGNGYAEIEPDQAGRPFALWPIHPDRVQVCRAIEPGTDAYGDAIQTGAIFYEVTQGDYQSSSAAKIILSAKRAFHIRGFGDGPVGVNVIHYAAESLGWVKAVELFGASFFGNGANVAAIIVNKRPLSPAGIKRQKEQFDKLYKGPRNANKTAILDNDADIKTLGVDAEKSQLSITHQALISEVCFVPGTQIVTPHGLMKIEAVRVGDTVLTHRGRWRLVTNVMQRDYVGRTVTVTAKGLLPVTATENHPFFAATTKRSRTNSVEVISGPEWINAGNLTPVKHTSDGSRSRAPSHALTMPKLAHDKILSEIDIAEWSGPHAVLNGHDVSPAHGSARSCRRKIHLDYDFGWVCGLFAADGSASTRQSTFYIGAHEQDIVEHLVRRIEALFGIVASATTANSVTRVTISQISVATLFGEFGHAAEIKALPDWCMAGGDEFNRGLIDGLVAGDGCEYANRRMLRTTSINLAWQLRVLLWGAGVNTTLQTQIAGQWEINGRSGQSLPMMTVEWRKTPERRGIMFDIDGDVSAFTLKSAESALYSGKVFNLEVAEDESYTTVGGVVHNCRWFGVPPHKVMDLSRGTFSNIEHQSIEVVVDSIAPWVKRFEDEADWKLFGSQNRQNFYTKMNMRGLLRGDAAARVAYYDGMVKIGAYSPNRVLEIEDENTIGPDGDIHVMQSQNVTLKQIAEGTATAKPGDTTPQDPKAPTEPAAPPETDTSQAYSVTPEILDLSAALGAQIQTQSIPVHV